MSTPRDTQFAGFAKAVYEEMRAQAVEQVMQNKGVDHTQNATPWSEIVTDLITKRAYDLACHVFDNTSSYMVDCMEADEAVIAIPDLTDLTELPEVKQ